MDDTSIIILEHGKKPRVDTPGGVETAPYAVSATCDYCNYTGWGIDVEFDIVYEENDDVEIRCIACDSLIDWLDDQGRSFEEYRDELCGGDR